MVLKAMREQGWLGKERVEIQIDHPLKTLGEHLVEVDLKKGLRAKLTVVLRQQP
jgi:ribosomal protein L9